MNSDSVLTEDPDITPDQRKKQKFEKSAIGRYLSTCSDFNSSFTATSFSSSPHAPRPHPYLTPITIRRKPKVLHNPTRRPTTSIPSLSQALSTPSQDYTVYWSIFPAIRWNPETRQQATLTVVGNTLYLIGGISRGIAQDVNAFSPFTSTWQRINSTGLSEPRFGHSALAYSGQIFVFGGGTNFNTHHGLRECINGVKKFMPQTGEWAYVKTSGTYICARKCHAASVIGKHMLISGGFNDKNNVLQDTAVLNLEKYSWHAVDLIGCPPLGLAFHTAVTASSNTSALSIYKFTDLKLANFGIYIFGGIDGKKNASNVL